jgi:uncharacterized protein
MLEAAPVAASSSCKGQCPGTAIDGDWRNRTEHCEIWKELYERIEAELIAAGEEPLSLSAARRGVEAEVVDGWSRGDNIALHTLLLRRKLANTDGEWRSILRNLGTP